MSSSKPSAVAVAASLCLCGGVALAQTPFAYPPEGRNAEAQRQDQYECHQWAVEQSGFDPAQAVASPPQTASTAPTRPAEAQSRPRAPVLGNAARGAAIAEVAGGDAGDGAAAAGALGLVRGRLAQRSAAQEQAAAQAQAQQQTKQQQSAQAEEVKAKQQAYQSARSACLKGRGYTVSTS